MRTAAGIVFCFFLASAEAADDAFLLLQKVGESARMTNNWRAEVVEVHQITGQGMNLRDEVHFKIAVKGPLKMRRESTGADNAISVCDGTDKFYTGDGHGFYRTPAAVSNDCNLPLAEFYKLEDSPTSAVITGRDRVQLTEGLRECDVVRAEWTVDVNDTGRHWQAIRNMCIDTERLLILRDTLESTDSASDLHSLRTITFLSLEKNPLFTPDTFQVSLPTGAVEDQGPLPARDGPDSVNGVYRIGSVASYPRLVSKVEPAYPEEARAYAILGTVLVSITVDHDGTPKDIKITRGLGPGFDEKAIECVRKWHFDPGMREGEPVALGPLTVAVRFRLP